MFILPPAGPYPGFCMGGGGGGGNAHERLQHLIPSAAVGIKGGSGVYSPREMWKK